MDIPYLLDYQINQNNTDNFEYYFQQKINLDGVDKFNLENTNRENTNRENTNRENTNRENTNQDKVNKLTLMIKNLLVTK